MHDRDHAQDDKAPESSAGERAPAIAAQVPAAIALQRKIGNRAFGQLISRATSPEEYANMLDPAINGAHVDVDQISRVLLPLSKDQEAFDTMAETYETKLKTPLQGALESRLGAEDMFEVGKRVPWRGFPPPKDAAGGGGAA